MHMAKKDIISIEHLTKQYGTATVLDDVTLSFQEGKIYGIVGRNGSGKTVLMKCICGFIHPTSGTVTVNGKVVGKEIDTPEDLGVIIETPGFIRNYSGYKNLSLLAAVRNRISKEEIIEALNKVGLDSTSKKHVGKYSLGMRQKLGIAQAIMESPSILVLDEPMNGLDNKSVDSMREMFKDLSEKGTTILLASHNREDVEYLCEEVIRMDDGKVISIEKESVHSV